MLSVVACSDGSSQHGEAAQAVNYGPIPSGPAPTNTYCGYGRLFFDGSCRDVEFFRGLVIGSYELRGVEGCKTEACGYAILEEQKAQGRTVTTRWVTLGADTGVSLLGALGGSSGVRRGIYPVLSKQQIKTSQTFTGELKSKSTLHLRTKRGELALVERNTIEIDDIRSLNDNSSPATFRACSIDGTWGMGDVTCDDPAADALAQSGTCTASTPLCVDVTNGATGASIDAPLWSCPWLDGALTSAPFEKQGLQCRTGSGFVNPPATPIAEGPGQATIVVPNCMVGLQVAAQLAEIGCGLAVTAGAAATGASVGLGSILVGFLSKIKIDAQLTAEAELDVEGADVTVGGTTDIDFPTIEEALGAPADATRLSATGADVIEAGHGAFMDACAAAADAQSRALGAATGCGCGELNSAQVPAVRTDDDDNKCEGLATLDNCRETFDTCTCDVTDFVEGDDC